MTDRSSTIYASYHDPYTYLLSTIVKAHAALTASPYPKLLFAAEPGALVAPAFAEKLAAELQDCRFIKLGTGKHFLPEDHPEKIGTRVAAFIAEIERRASA